MRKKELKNELDGFTNFGREINYLKVRNARSGGYKDELNLKDIQFCNDQMKYLDSYFDY